MTGGHNEMENTERSGGERRQPRRDSRGFGRGNRDSGRKFGQRNRPGFRSNFENREMHKAVCSECKQNCEVPFKPTEGKPVYCKECFMKNKKF